MRLDNELVNRKLFISRSKAKEEILQHKIMVNGIVCIKPSENVDESDTIELIGDTLPFVGRGGLKLEKIACKHDLLFENKVCMDIGASTGGFTDCMLQRGAELVYAVDVGSNQLAESLRNNPKVFNMEKTDIRNINSDDLSHKIDFISIDVSFISLKLVLPKAYELLTDNGNIAALVKPQFEAGRQNIGKNGIVKSSKVHENILIEIIDFAEKIGFEIVDVDFSPVTGGKGNIEYLLFMKKGTKNKIIDIHNIVKLAFENFKSGGRS